MGRKVTIEIKPNGRQANACCSVLYQVPCIWCSMPHRQVHRLIRCTCLHCDLLPKRNELHANDVYIQQIFEKGRHSYYAANRLLGRLSHIYYQNKYQLLSRVGSNRQHLLSQAFPFGCLSYLLCHNLRCVPHPHLSVQCRQNPQREVLTNYHNYHLYSIHNACRYYTSQRLLCACVSTCMRIYYCQYRLVGLILPSKIGLNNLCSAQIFRVHNLANFLLVSGCFYLKMPTCYFHNNTKPLKMPLDKQGKFHQSCFGKNHQTPLLLEFQKANLMAFRHRQDLRQQKLESAKILADCPKWFSILVHSTLYKSVQPLHFLGKSNNSFLDNNSEIHQKLVFQSFRNSFLFVIFSFSYNPCIILINFINYSLRFEGEITSRLEIFDFAEVPLTQNRKNLLLGRWNSVAVNPLGIDPVNRTLSNILELGWEGLSMNISPCAAPSKFRSLTPALRVETMGGGNLAEFPLNVRQNKNAPAIRTGMGLQGHIYVVPKPSYLFYAIATLTLNQKALQKYNEFPNHARNVNFVLTFGRERSEWCCRKIAAMCKSLCHNALCAKSLHDKGCKFVVLNVVGSSPTGHPTNKPSDYQVIRGYFCTQNRPNPP